MLTINGKAELVVQDTASYQKLIELAERADGWSPPGIHRGHAGREGQPGRGHAGRDAEHPRREARPVSYRVVVTARARADAVEAFRWIAERSPAAAARWYDGFQKAIAKLATMPERCPVAEDESEQLGIKRLVSVLFSTKNRTDTNYPAVPPQTIRTATGQVVPNGSEIVPPSLTESDNLGLDAPAADPEQKRGR